MLNARECSVVAERRARPGNDLRRERRAFAELGFHIEVLLPGQPNCMYHGESDQEDFLVVSGECIVDPRRRGAAPQGMGLRPLPADGRARLRRRRRRAVRDRHDRPAQGRRSRSVTRSTRSQRSTARACSRRRRTRRRPTRASRGRSRRDTRKDGCRERRHRLRPQRARRDRGGDARATAGRRISKATPSSRSWASSSSCFDRASRTACTTARASRRTSSSSPASACS